MTIQFILLTLVYGIRSPTEKPIRKLNSVTKGQVQIRRPRQTITLQITFEQTIAVEETDDRTGVYGGLEHQLALTGMFNLNG